MPAVELQVRQAITDALALEKMIDPDTPFETLDMDSLDVVLMCQELEDQLDCSIDLSSLRGLKTPAEVVEFIQKLQTQ